MPAGRCRATPAARARDPALARTNRPPTGVKLLLAQHGLRPQPIVALGRAARRPRRRRQRLRHCSMRREGARQPRGGRGLGPIPWLAPRPAPRADWRPARRAGSPQPPRRGWLERPSRKGGKALRSYRRRRTPPLRPCGTSRASAAVDRIARHGLVTGVDESAILCRPGARSCATAGCSGRTRSACSVDRDPGPPFKRGVCALRLRQNAMFGSARCSARFPGRHAEGIARELNALAARSKLRGRGVAGRGHVANAEIVGRELWLRE